MNCSCKSDCAAAVRENRGSQLAQWALRSSFIACVVASLLQFWPGSSRIKAAAGITPVDQGKCHEVGKALGCSV